MDDTESRVEEPTTLPLEDSIAPTATKLKADNSIQTLLKTKRAVQSSNGPTSQGASHHRRANTSPKAPSSSASTASSRPNVKFTSTETAGPTPLTMVATGGGVTMANPGEGLPSETAAVTPKGAQHRGHSRNQQGSIGRPGTTQRKRASIALASEKFSFVEEGRNVRLGRKPTVNCWTVITVNGKEFVVEKEFKDGNVFKSSAQVNEKLESRPRTEFNPFRQSAGKVRCDLCLLYFVKDSVNGVISFKRILDLRRKWGLELRGRRCNAASYIYSEARLCLFCSQLLHVSNRDTCDASRQKPPVESTEHIQFADGEGGKAPLKGGLDGGKGERGKLGSTVRGDSNMERDMARGKPVVTSSVADASPGSLATSGVWKVGPNVAECCKTFHEYDPWLEVDMLALYHLKSVRVLHRIERRGDPRVYRMTPFWVILSRTPILAQDLHEARRRALYAVKVVKDEPISTVYIPKNIGPARHVRIQVEGARPLQLAGVQAVKGDMPQPKLHSTRSTTSIETRSGPITGLALLFANVKERAAAAAAAAAANGSSNGTSNATGFTSNSTITTVNNVLPTATAVLSQQRPNTTPSTVSLNGNQSYTDDYDSDSNSSCSVHYQRPQTSRPATAPKFYTRNMAEHCVDSLMTQALNGYRQQEEFEQRLASAKAAFTEQELPPLTELFLTVAQENGYPKTMSLEFIKVQTTSLIISLLSLRTRNTALKELLGEGSSLEALTEAIDNVCRMRQAERGGKAVKTIPADYTQYLEMVNMLRQGKVTLAEVSRIFAGFINKGRRQTTIETRGIVRPKTTQTEYDVALMDRDEQKMMHGLQAYLRQRQGFLKRYEKRAARDNTKPIEFVDWAKVIDERREHQEQLRLAAPPPDITPRLPHKACAVCLFHYPGDALVESVTVKSLANLFTRLNLPPDKYATRLEFGMNKFYRIPICVFCYQLFDPDEEDGIAKSTCTRDLIGYTPFFDDRYPERYSMADPVVKKKYTASSLLKHAAAILPVHTGGSSPCRGHA